MVGSTWSGIVFYTETKCIEISENHFGFIPASVAQGDAHQTGDQEVIGLNILSKTGHEIFSTVIHFLPMIQEGQSSVSGMCVASSNG